MNSGYLIQIGNSTMYCIFDVIGYFILSCCRHNNGTNHMMIHTLRLTFHILPARYPYQLLAAVLECSIMKTLNHTESSTQFQVN